MPAGRSIQSVRYLSGRGAGAAFGFWNVPFASIEQTQRAVLVVLMSALWLVASGHSVFDQPDSNLVGLNSRSSSSIAEGKYGPLDHLCYLDPVARRINRRLGIQPNGDGSVPPVVAGSSALPLAKPPFILLSAFAAPLGLAECWQFYWRTALDPRAPSRIS
jgi:hypothetical protein